MSEHRGVLQNIPAKTLSFRHEIKNLVDENSTVFEFTVEVIRPTLSAGNWNNSSQNAILSDMEKISGCVILLFLLGCGRAHPPEERLRAYFGISQEESVNTGTIQNALNNQLPVRSSWAEVQEYIRQHGLGKDGLSECKVIEGKGVRCSAFYFPPNDARSKRAYQVTWVFDRPNGSLVRLNVGDVLVEVHVESAYR